MQRKVVPARSAVGAVRALFRRVGWLFRIVEARRRASDERAYVALRERYARAFPWTSAAAELTRSRELLTRRWGGPVRTYADARDVRLFVVSGETETTPTFLHELKRSFDAEVFDFVDYLPARRSQVRDLAWRAKLQRDMLAAFRTEHERRPFDLAFLYVTHFECSPETLRSIEETGVPTVVWCGDDKHSFEEAPGIPSGQRALIGAATLHATNSLECVRWYAAEDALAYYMPPGADPEIFRPLGLPRDIDVSFVGGWYGARRELIARLRERGIDVRCWGPQTDGGPLDREGLVSVLNRSKVNLGFGGVAHMSKVTCLKTRDFEVPMTGSLYLTQYSAELADQYAIGREILCYLNEIDCVEQIRLILAQPERARAIGNAARERSIHCCTWTRRVSDLLEWMGIVTPSERSST